MFKKTERLSHSEFTEYFKKGRRIQSPHLTFVVTPADKLKTAVVVGKKVSKTAVRRNLLKRRIYAALRDNLSKSDFKGVVIVIVKPSYNTIPRKSALTIFNEAFQAVIKK